MNHEQLILLHWNLSPSSGFLLSNYSETTQKFILSQTSLKPHPLIPSVCALLALSQTSPKLVPLISSVRTLVALLPSLFNVLYFRIFLPYFWFFIFFSVSIFLISSTEKLKKKHFLLSVISRLLERIIISRIYC